MINNNCNISRVAVEIRKLMNKKNYFIEGILKMSINNNNIEDYDDELFTKVKVKRFIRARKPKEREFIPLYKGKVIKDGSKR